MNVWIGEYEAPADRFGLVLHGQERPSLTRPARVKKVLKDAAEVLTKVEVRVRRDGDGVVATLLAREAHLFLDARDPGRAEVSVRGLRRLDLVVRAVEGLVMWLRPAEVELAGGAPGGSGRRAYSPDVGVFVRQTFATTSDFQPIEVGEHPTFGRMLFLGGEAQIASTDEQRYSSALVKPAMDEAVKRVCIMGGGDCGVLREVLAYPAVEEAVMVEIDPAVIDVAAEHFPAVVGRSREDPRTRIVVGDAFAYVRDHQGFDLIVYDLCDTPLNLDSYGEVFPLIASALKPGGKVAVQCGSGLPLDRPRLDEILAAMSRTFDDVRTVRVEIPSFIQPWVFGYGRRRAPVRP